MENQNRKQNTVHRFQIVTQIHRERGNRIQSPDLEIVKSDGTRHGKNDQLPRFRNRRQEAGGRKHHQPDWRKKRKR